MLAKEKEKTVYLKPVPGQQTTSKAEDRIAENQKRPFCSVPPFQNFCARSQMAVLYRQVSAELVAGHVAMISGWNWKVSNSFSRNQCRSPVMQITGIKQYKSKRRCVRKRGTRRCIGVGGGRMDAKAALSLLPKTVQSNTACQA